ncbi:hydroxymethylglutaryl-CoA reductase, degradative [Candidatus Micrarchaeota archaeon CG1_02_51_15]|nr:MAG: hydroxymethylglutaryl-CoA reductase, degradative [Candidatus Micrarchaeota archaeon CG1_02_51_15]
MYIELRKLSVNERLEALVKAGIISQEQACVLGKDGPLSLEAASHMIENVVGTHSLPFALATNFVINGKDYMVPMAVEEPSVVAGACNAAKLSLPNGFVASADESIMIGQIQLVKLPDCTAAVAKILAVKQLLIERANACDPVLLKFGGGCRGVECREIDSPRGKMLVVHLLVDVRDAMGANAVNSMAESIAPELERITGGQARLRILSNLADKRLVRAKTVWTKQALEESTKGAMKGEEVVEAVLDAGAFAQADSYRAATHNKGIMNGVDAVVVATGNDWRAIEAGAHAFAARTGKYLPLTKYRKTAEGDLEGEIQLPVAVGLVGGATKTHPTAQIAVKILGVKTAQELAQVIASVGLAQNFAALRALATEGINRGHLKLHAHNLAIAAGAGGAKAEAIAAQMATEGKVSAARAKELLERT